MHLSICCRDHGTKCVHLPTLVTLTGSIAMHRHSRSSRNRSTCWDLLASSLPTCTGRPLLALPLLTCQQTSACSFRPSQMLAQTPTHHHLQSHVVSMFTCMVNLVHAASPGGFDLSESVQTGHVKDVSVRFACSRSEKSAGFRCCQRCAVFTLCDRGLHRFKF